MPTVAAATTRPPGPQRGVADIPWFKVDDGFSVHPKAILAGNAACGLWVRAGSWSMQQLTDGFVPEHVLPMLGTAKEAQRLVEACLWQRVDGGWRFHEWETRQPSREHVEKERADAAERQRRARERRAAMRDEGGDES